MAARSCARRAHQLAASILSSGVGPSRLPTASTCRCQLGTPSNISSPSPPRWSARSFSSSTRCFEDAASQSATTQDDAQPTHAGTKSARLLGEEVADAEPTLEYLDSLKPKPRRQHPDQHRQKRGNVSPFAKASSSKNSAEHKQWERTRARINASFTRNQLASLARAAKLPGSYARTVRKDELVRRIMVHRFGMEDARERADREKREELEKRSVHIGFRPSEMYLLLARGSSKVRQEASKAQVAILPQAPAKASAQQDGSSEKLGFWIRGKDQGIERMTKWVSDFKATIQHREEVVVLSAEARDAEISDPAVSEMLPAELVRFISQLSRCFMEASPIQNGKVTLSLAYLDERDAQKAVLLLRQYHAESAEAMQRLGAAAYSDGLDADRKYSMLPFVPNEPTPWIKQADDLLYGSHSDISFRVSSNPELNAFSMLSTAKLTAMKLHAWNHQGDKPFAEPFRTLIESSEVQTPVNGNNEVEINAELGYVLFDAGGLTLADEGLSEQEMLSRLQDPLAAPRPGTWPIEDVLTWTRQFRSRFGREASRFVPATLFRSQKNISLDIWLDRQGYVLADEGKAEARVEQVVLVYQSAEAGHAGHGSKLEIVLTRQRSEADVAEGAGGGWAIHQARWMSGAQSDVMIPEKGADLRLSAKTTVPLEGEALAAVEESLASYISSKPAPVAVGEAEDAAEPTEEEATEAREEVDGVLGGETEMIERSEAAATAPTVAAADSPAVQAGALPPSILDIASVGTLALESATRSRTQTYLQRAAVAPTPILARPASEIGSTATTESEPEPVVEPSSDAITTAEVTEQSVTPETPTDQVATTSEPQSPLLIRTISQDIVTHTTTESMRLTWRLASSDAVPEWQAVVQPISALLDRHHLSTR